MPSRTRSRTAPPITWTCRPRPRRCGRRAARRSPPYRRDAASVADLHPAHVPAAGPGAEYATLQGAIGPGFVGIVVVIIRAVIAERHEGETVRVAPMVVTTIPIAAIIAGEVPRAAWSRGCEVRTVIGEV